MMKLASILFVCILGVLLLKAESQPLEGEGPRPQCELPIDLAILVDISSTITSTDFPRLKYFLNTLVEGVSLKYARIAIVTFNQQPNMEKDLDDCTTTDCLSQAANNIRQPGGTTDIEAALRFADTTVFSASRGDRPGVEDVIVVITDGSQSKEAVDPQLLWKLKVQRDMRVIVVAVGKGADSDQVFEIATDPFYENVFFANTYWDLQRVAGDMTQLYCVEGLSRPPPDSLLPESCVYDIGLLVDLSGSIIQSKPYYDNWIQLREFLKAFVKQVKQRFPSVNIALEFFRNQGNLVYNFQECGDFACMHEKMKVLPVPWGSTYMKDAFEVMEKNVIDGGENRPDVDDLIILMTDGFPTNQEQMPTEVAKRLKDKKIRIYGIGVTENVNKATMRDVVSDPFNENYEPAENYRKMARRINDIIAKTCRVPKEACDITADIAVLVDLSGSIGTIAGGYERMQEFVTGISDSIKFPNARMAIVYFQDTATTFVRLNQCTHSACVRRLINSLPKPGGSTNMDDAFAKAKNEVFTGPGGDRDNAQNIIILVTDGAPNIDSPEGKQALKEFQDDPNTRIIVLPVSVDADMRHIYEVASRPVYQNVLFSANFVDLVDNLPKIKDLICQPTVTPTPPVIEPEICDYDIAFLIDVSGSIHYYDPKGNNFVLLRKFLQNFVRRLKGLPKGDVKIALEYFGNEAVVLTYFDSCNDNEDVECIVDSLWSLPRDPTAQTRMKLGFEVMRDTVFGTRGDRPHIDNLIILISDGFPEPFAPNNPISVTDQIKSMGTRIMAVGITDRVNNTIMEQVVSSPSQDNFIPVDDFQALEKAVNKILDASCKPVRRIRPCKGDIIFLLDSSGSMSLDDWDTMKQFVSHLTRQLPIGMNDVRVGAIKFSTRFEKLFDLKDFNSQSRIEVTIRDTPYMGEDTHTWEVLPYIQDEMFTAAMGDRPNYPNYLVIFTDGGSQDPESTKIAAKAMQSKANCTVVQIGSKFDQEELRALASDPDSRNLIRIRAFSTLEQKVEYLMNEILNPMCGNECPEDACPAGSPPVMVDGACVC